MNYTELPFYYSDGGLQTETTTYLGPTGRVFYVSATTRTFDNAFVRGRTYTTLNAALGQCASGNGDTVFVLPGHTESITGADQMNNLVAGTNIIGLGRGNNRPQFTWTQSGSTWLMNKANVVLNNLILLMEPGTGTITVTAPMTISAAGCSIIGCRVRTATDASNLTTIALALTDAADQCTLIGNRFYGATAGECTTQVDIAGADDLLMERNSFLAATSSVNVGTVRFKTTAATNIVLRENVYTNKKAASTMAVTGVAAVTGTSYNELFSYLDNTTTTMWGTSPGLMSFFNPRTSNLAGEAGMLSTVVST